MDGAGASNSPIWNGAGGTNDSLNLLTTGTFPRALTMTCQNQTSTTVVSITANSIIPANTWVHVAAVRYGSNFYLFVGGVLVGQATYAGALSDRSGAINQFLGGIAGQGGDFLGAIDDFRFTTGIALYTQNFTPTTVPFGSPLTNPIQFIGDATLAATGTMALEWQISQYSADGSVPFLSYSINAGATVTTVQLGGGQSPQSGVINVPLAGATGIIVSVSFVGGTITTGAVFTNVAVSITRNKTQPNVYNVPIPFNPTGYNAQRLDFSGVPSATLAQLRQRLLIRLGFAAQAMNPPPGMAAFCNDQLFGAQNFLYRRFASLHTRRFFRWELVPGQRFYSLLDNDEDVLSNYHLDPNKKIEWVGIQDTRNVWYPMLQGIDPQLFTMVQTPWRPARYDIRQGIEIYPAPDQTYYMWMRGHFGLLSFVNDSDTTTLDSELVFLWALGNAKAHYAQPDANNIAAQANAYKGELIAGTHHTAHYIPATAAVPPAVRPVLTQFSS
jgi:hypothetical protein